MNWLRRYLLHERLRTRFLSLFLSIAFLFLSTWTISFFLLPEGLLRGRNIAQIAGGEGLWGDSVWLEWLRLLAINIFVMFVLVGLPNILRDSNGIPLGYTTITVIACYFGMVLGTNSFAIDVGGRIPPTIEILGSSGFYEISAYILTAASTISISRYRIIGNWPKQKVEKIIPSLDRSQRWERSFGIVIAIMMVIVACGWEAFNIAQRLA